MARTISVTARTLRDGLYPTFGTLLAGAVVAAASLTAI